MPSPDRRILLLMPPRRRDQVFPPHVMARLGELGEAIVPDGDTAALAAALPDLLPTADACVTGWGAPLLRDDLLDRAPRLRPMALSSG